MISEKKAILRLESKNDGESLRLRQQTVALQESLNRFSEIRAASTSEVIPTQDNVEKKGELMLLYTLALTFISTGTAKALIDGLRATFSATRDSSLKATLQINGREIEITAEHLTERQVDKLMRLIDQEIKS